MTKLKYLRIREDGNQLILTSNGAKIRPNTSIILKNEPYLCPFCLYEGYIKEFSYLLKNKKISKNRFQCPECGNVMLKESLVKEMSIEEFAIWIWNYPAPDYWSKCNFYTFIERLKQRGIYYQFWNNYYALKNVNMPYKIATKRPDAPKKLDKGYGSLREDKR